MWISPFQQTMERLRKGKAGSICILKKNRQNRRTKNDYKSNYCTHHYWRAQNKMSCKKTTKYWKFEDFRSRKQREYRRKR